MKFCTFGTPKFSKFAVLYVGNSTVARSPKKCALSIRGYQNCVSRRLWKLHEPCRHTYRCLTIAYIQYDVVADVYKFLIATLVNSGICDGCENMPGVHKVLRVVGLHSRGLIVLHPFVLKSSQPEQHFRDFPPSSLQHWSMENLLHFVMNSFFWQGTAAVCAYYHGLPG